MWNVDWVQNKLTAALWVMLVRLFIRYGLLTQNNPKPNKTQRVGLFEMFFFNPGDEMSLLSDPHPRVHRVFTGSEHSYQCWQRDWLRDQCVTVAQVRTGHSSLVAAYLHRIGRLDSAICPHCHSADETVEHLVFQCPAHDHARRDTWPGEPSQPTHDASGATWNGLGR